MNMDLKRVRETVVEDSPSPAKRRAVSTPDPEDDKLEDWMKVLETKRKEAIYRQMLEYRRSYEQEQRRVSELEAQRRVLETSVHAVEVCWTQLVAAVTNLAPADSATIKPEEALEPVLDPQVSYPELDAALQTRLPATTGLFTRFVQAFSQDPHRPVPPTDLQKRCSALQAESSRHRSHAQALKSDMRQMTESRDALQKELQRTQKSLDRQRMEHDKVEVEWRLSKERDVDSITKSRRPNGSGHATPNGKVDEDVKPLNGSEQTLSGISHDNSEWETLAASRLKELQEVRRNQIVLQQENDRLHLVAHNPSETSIRESPFFQIYLNQLATQTNQIGAMQQRLVADEKLLDHLRTGNQNFKELITSEARQEVEVLRAQMQRKDQDLVRVRAQRDEYTDENTERKAKEIEKLKYGEEMETLAKSRAERIATLVSEVRRLKGCLGASEGSRGYLAFLNGEGGIDGDYVKSLEQQLDQTRVKREEEDPAGADDKDRLHLDVKAESGREDVQPEQADMQDVSQLDRLRKEKDILELKVSESDIATNALYSEVETLSKLYENLDKTVQKKVFDLRDSENKTARALHEKAKADNKYFQAMRAKDAIDVECKTAQKSVERQTKLLERAQETEKTLTAQIVAHESGLIALKNSASDLQSQLASVTSEKTQLEFRLQQSQTSLADAQQIMKQRVSEAATDKAERERCQEEAERAEKKYKKLQEKHDAMMASTASGENASVGEWKMKAERDKLWKLLRCSCCEQNFKQQVITRCMHTFCKDCLDQRIASRQRKCPACGVAFAKEDVGTLYWQ